MITNPSPKARFIHSKEFVEKHRELMQRDDLQRGLDYALLEYQKEVAMRTNEQMAGTGHFRIVGALEFIQILKDLAEPMAIMPKREDKTLNYRA